MAARAVSVAVAMLAMLAPGAVAAPPFQPGAIGFSHRPVCGSVPVRVARCHAQVVIAATGAPLVTPGPAGYGPDDLQSAYSLASEAASGGGTQTAAIVDAYDDPNAEADLGVYRSQFGLAPCTTANGCFQKVNQTGGTTYPHSNGGWAQEISLDLDMVSAICPNCQILLVETDSNAFANLVAGVDTAAALGATQISNSYGGSEYSGETSDESHYNHPGVAVTVSSGDSGYGVEFPAASRYVTAVGGTSLQQDSGSASGWSETAWSGAGSGCSAYVPKPSWQTDSGCAHRTVADVSAVADPNTGVAVYDSLAYQGASGWMVFGGTSAAAPIVAGFDALQGAGAASPSFAYENPSSFNDVTSGSNGNCGTYLCEAGAGYDGPTGLGTPQGTPLTGVKPSASTGSATSIVDTTATLNGSVNPNGLATTYRFEYGTTTAYGSQSPAVDASAGAGSSTVAESTNLTGLTAATTYHFRLVATNSAGTTLGSDQSFTTGAKPAVTTQAASSVTATGATLHGAINPERLATTYHFEYGTTTAYGAQAPALDASAGSGSNAVAATATVSSLTAGTTYHFRLVATNAAGTTTGADQSFTTIVKPTVTTGSATSIVDTTATLNGSVNPNGLATTYRFEYGTTSTYGSQSPAVDASAGAGSSTAAVSADLTGLSAATTYHYRLVATNSAGTTAGSDQTFTTGDKPAVTNQAAGSITAIGATLHGSVNPDRLATTYRFEYGTTTAYGAQSPAVDASAGSGSSAVPVSAPLSSLTAATTYHFRLAATNAAGTTLGADQTFITSPPPATTNTSTTTTPPPTNPLSDLVNAAAPLPPTLAVARHRRSSVLRHGLHISVGCSTICSIAASLAADATAASRLHLSARKPMVVARARHLPTPPGTVKLVLRLTRRARVALARTRSVTLSLKVVVTDASGARHTLTRRVTIRAG